VCNVLELNARRGAKAIGAEESGGQTRGHPLCASRRFAVPAHVPSCVALREPLPQRRAPPLTVPAHKRALPPPTAWAQAGQPPNPR
jgi:hypothetical protein